MPRSSSVSLLLFSQHPEINSFFDESMLRNDDFSFGFNKSRLFDDDDEANAGGQTTFLAASRMIDPAVVQPWVVVLLLRMEEKEVDGVSKGDEFDVHLEKADTDDAVNWLPFDNSGYARA